MAVPTGTTNGTPGANRYQTLQSSLSGGTAVLDPPTMHDAPKKVESVHTRDPDEDADTSAKATPPVKKALKPLGTLPGLDSDDQVSDDTPVLSNAATPGTGSPNDLAGYIGRGVRSLIFMLKGRLATAQPSTRDVPEVASSPDRNSLRRENPGSISSYADSHYQEVLVAHSKLNSSGRPVDEKGKEINLVDMNVEFAKRLAQTSLDLDAAGYKGQYNILSGVRSHDEQAGLYNFYKSQNSKHPVALPGHSPHEWGVATDLQYTGKGSAEQFYAALHVHGRNNGMEFVANDPNHVQLANAHQVIAELRQSRNGIEVASLPRDRTTALST